MSSSTNIVLITKRLGISLLILFYCQMMLGQEQSCTIDSTENASRLQELDLRHGYKKSIVPEYKLAFLIALSYYPELDSTRIRFKETRINTTLNVRPTIVSLLFHKKENRTYIVRINNHVKDSLILLNQVPFNAKIGLFGHELTHIIDYRSKNIFGMIKRMFEYGNAKQKEAYEKEIDMSTIQRGLGWQLNDWTCFIHFHSNAAETYKCFKCDIYLEPHEIMEILKKLKE